MVHSSGSSTSHQSKNHIKITVDASVQHCNPTITSSTPVNNHLLTPPLTPASSLRSDKPNPEDPVEETMSDDTNASHFVLLSKVPKGFSEEGLASTIQLPSCAPNNPTEHHQGDSCLVNTQLYATQQYVILTFYDIRVACSVVASPEGVRCNGTHVYAKLISQDELCEALNLTQAMCPVKASLTVVLDVPEVSEEGEIVGAMAALTVADDREPSVSVEAGHLHSLFAQFGDVRFFDVRRSEEKPEPSLFVDFYDARDAVKAASSLHDQPAFGVILRILDMPYIEPPVYADDGPTFIADFASDSLPASARSAEHDFLPASEPKDIHRVQTPSTVNSQASLSPHAPSYSPRTPSFTSGTTHSSSSSPLHSSPHAHHMPAPIHTFFPQASPYGPPSPSYMHGSAPGTVSPIYPHHVHPGNGQGIGLLSPITPIHSQHTPPPQTPLLSPVHHLSPYPHYYQQISSFFPPPPSGPFYSSPPYSADQGRPVYSPPAIAHEHGRPADHSPYWAEVMQDDPAPMAHGCKHNQDHDNHIIKPNGEFVFPSLSAPPPGLTSSVITPPSSSPASSPRAHTTQRTLRPSQGRLHTGLRHNMHHPAASHAPPARNELNVARIECGEDTRTTVMIKNIPNKMSDNDLLTYIQRVVPRRIDFMYLRMDFQNGCNVGYAFVNFISVSDLLKFAKAKLGVKWNMFSSEKVLQMSYANYQGKEALVEKFKNSCIMDEREAWRPKIFYSEPGEMQGLSEEFPPPTHMKRKERSSHNRGALYVPSAHRG